ncbi:NAD(P)-dependent alcohol dehydrogenase [Terrabacter sp. Ter38]|uniref:NAD(P)-dependent alcohol dehydrogenase n=1 Tax=Terrabacter sp. Ter38 TaxID=2926030 RepID=UPI002119119B|nr:NAD(P)-dependent alcohol dehydrogenase [Terrabacter sp. Ter38]
MKAVIQDKYGSSEVLRVADFPVPEPGDHEVLIKVRAAGLDRCTEHLMTGKPYAMRLATGLRRPKNPVSGRDVAGTVVKVGSAVTRFAPGDEVYGVAPGSFAEYAVGPEKKLAHKPSSLTFEQAAVVPISAGTALQALRDVGKVQPGQQVLIIGASGGVGSYAVQLAKILGAQVTGVASASKADFVRSLGADHVLDYNRDDFADVTRHYDLILDIGGGSTLTRLRRALKRRGTAVFVGSENSGNITGMGRQLRGAVVSLFVPQRLALLMAKERASDYEQLTEHLQAGRLRATLADTYSLDRAKDAVTQLEEGKVRGKVVIVPSHPAVGEQTARHADSNLPS